MTVLLQVLTLFLLIFCGFFSAKRKMIDEHGISALNNLVLNFALPATILYGLQEPADAQLIHDLILVFVCTCALLILCSIIAFGCFFREPAERRSVLTNLSTFSNCSFMGYPVITACLGEDILIYAVMFNGAFSLMSWTLGAFVFGGIKAVQPRRLFANPSLIAVLLGLVLFLTGLELPSFINNALSLMGNATTPLAMFVIGARLINIQLSHFTDKSLLLACLLRLILFPAAVLLLRLTSLSPVVINTLYICTAMPGAALTAMQSELFRCDSALASRGVAISVAFSLITIPLMLLLV